MNSLVVGMGTRLDPVPDTIRVVTGKENLLIVAYEQSAGSEEEPEITTLLTIRKEDAFGLSISVWMCILRDALSVCGENASNQMDG